MKTRRITAIARYLFIRKTEALSWSQRSPDNLTRSKETLRLFVDRKAITRIPKHVIFLSY